MTRRQAATGLVAAVAATLCLPAHAQQASDAPRGANLYPVEVVIFRGAGAAAGEDLAAAARNLTQDSDSAAAETARSARLGELLPSTRYKLSDAAARLNASGRKVIAHIAWTQSASAWNSGSGLSAEQLGLAASGISGLVQLERGTYLHLGFNLVYAPAGGARYALNEMRRVKFAERNYFDHPAIGIIALVTPGGDGR
jgi:hypothetical protein